MCITHILWAREKDRGQLKYTLAISKYILKNKIMYLSCLKKVQDKSKPPKFWKYMSVFLHVESKTSSSILSLIIIPFMFF